MQLHQETNSSQHFWIFGIVLAVLLSVMTVLGGTPEQDRMLIFVVGTILTIGGMLVIGAVGWHLLVRPLPEGYKSITQALVSDRTRYLMGLLMVLGSLNIMIAASWDEVWHSKYGIPFGEDFFWRPHQMMYFGFIVTIGVAAFGLWRIMTQGNGTLQQRFRMDTTLGLAGD